MTDGQKILLLHIGIVATLAVLYFILPDYHVNNLSRILVMTVYAMGYNLLFGYTGLISLGHALFFAAGMYGFGLAVSIAGFQTGLAILTGLGFVVAIVIPIGFLALRTRDAAFMIVTLMFAQAGYLVALYFGEFTRGDEGFVIEQSARMIFGLDFSNANMRFWAAHILFSASFLTMAFLVKSRFGRILIAVRENEDRARMLGYDTHRMKLLAVLISGVFSGMAGIAYAILFGYVGATFATVQYSILPLLWVLLGGMGTTVGPLIGVYFMFYLIDVASSLTDAYLLVAGVVLVLLVLFAPQGIGGEIRKRGCKWLP